MAKYSALYSQALKRISKLQILNIFSSHSMLQQPKISKREWTSLAQIDHLKSHAEKTDEFFLICSM